MSRSGCYNVQYRFMQCYDKFLPQYQFDQSFMIHLAYTCRYPLMIAPLVDDSILQYPSSDINPASEGTVITFTCSTSDLVLTGPNSTICMSNGEWEPDPMEVACKGIVIIIIMATNCCTHHIGSTNY